MYHASRFFVFSFFFAFFSVVSLWTYPHKPYRGVASVDSEHHAAPYHYDASYKL